MFASFIIISVAVIVFAIISICSLFFVSILVLPKTHKPFSGWHFGVGKYCPLAFHHYILNGLANSKSQTQIATNIETSSNVLFVDSNGLSVEEELKGTGKKRQTKIYKV